MQAALESLVGSVDLGAQAPRLAFLRPAPEWTDALSEPTLSLYCTALQEPASSPRFETEVRLAARFLVTAWPVRTDPDATEAARTDADGLLARLWLALELAPPPPDANPLIEPALSPTPDSFWLAMGLPPRPCLWLTVTAAAPRPQREVQPVQVRVFEGPPSSSPLVGLSPRGRGPLGGRVVRGPEQEGVAGALISLPALGRSTRSDQRGYFSFLDVPRDPLPRIEVRAGGLTATAESQLQEDRFAPILVHLEP